MCLIWGFQERFDDIFKPRMFVLLQGVIVLSSKSKLGMSVLLERDIVKNCVLRLLNLTRLAAPQVDTPRRSASREEIATARDKRRELDEGLDGNLVEE